MKQIKEENIKLKEVNRFKDREIEQRQGEVDAVNIEIVYYLFWLCKNIH